MAPSETEEKNGELNKFLVVNIAATIILLAVFFGVMYFTMNNMLEQKEETCFKSFKGFYCG